MIIKRILSLFKTRLSPSMKHSMKIKALFMTRYKIKQIIKKARLETLNTIIHYQITESLIQNNLIIISITTNTNL